MEWDYLRFSASFIDAAMCAADARGLHDKCVENGQIFRIFYDVLLYDLA